MVTDRRLYAGAPRTGREIVSRARSELPARAAARGRGYRADPGARARGPVAAGARRGRARGIAGTGARVLVNDRVDVALAAGADGVPLARVGCGVRQDSRDRSRRVSRRAFGAQRRRGRAAAADGGCDYLMFGTVFESRSKPAGHAVAGLDALADVCAAVPAAGPGHRRHHRGAGRRTSCGRGAAGLAAIGLFAADGEWALPRHGRPNPAGVRRRLTGALHILWTGYRSPLVDLFLRGEAARDVRLLAARGLLPRRLTNRSRSSWCSPTTRTGRLRRRRMRRWPASARGGGRFSVHRRPSRIARVLRRPRDAPHCRGDARGAPCRRRSMTRMWRRQTKAPRMRRRQTKARGCGDARRRRRGCGDARQRRR